jgi:hypothetical protein
MMEGVDLTKVYMQQCDNKTSPVQVIYVNKIFFKTKKR